MRVHKIIGIRTIPKDKEKPRKLTYDLQGWQKKKLKIKVLYTNKPKQAIQRLQNRIEVLQMINESTAEPK